MRNDFIVFKGWQGWDTVGDEIVFDIFYGFSFYWLLFLIVYN